MHNNTSAIPLGKAMLHMERGGNTHLLRFFVMQLSVMQLSVMPILGENTFIGMKLVQVLDCDDVHLISSDTPNLLMSKPLSDPILQQYHDVFSGLGEFPGEYTI